MIWRMFMAVTMELGVFVGKNFSNKRMFDLSKKLVSGHDENN